MIVIPRLMRGFSKVYSYINILSIDVALGACIMALFVGNIVNASISLSALSSLAISVWLIYTIDHLKDAKTIKHPSHTKRHQFHQLYYSQLKFVAGLILALQIGLLFFLPWSILIGGIVLILVVILYFIVLWSFKLKNIYHKELVIAIVYTCGIFLPVWGRIGNETYEFIVVLYFQIIFLAFSNLLMFSLLEMPSDEMDNQRSLALVIGKLKTTKIIFSTLLIGTFFSIFLAINYNSPVFRSAQIIFMMMNVILILILSVKVLKKEERFRYLGDGVFYLPLLHLLWQ